ncbi:hypothetical protein CcI49_14990 [Frankia sp. CcI49]|uniref:hypothetical protein n=1 Tax=Frankia sp. CcI49 TaxID=1745382 RepID=UPI00097565C2|nr:hypothetical protein [Frankia sp. CcI49]ONH60003.1 hypothetical protein CcI49_14990 [Frankia sp. CcI49]
MTRFDLGRRLEPIRPVTDLDRGFRAEIADPAWFLARQWHLGEHQGEDAASPALVRHVAAHHPVDPLLPPATDPDQATDPAVVPAEAIIEAESDEWWTPGRRIRVGRDLATSRPALLADTSLRLDGLPPPYDTLDGTGVDGLTAYRRRAELGLTAADFPGVPTVPAADLWDPAEFVHTAEFTSGGVALQVPRHRGGDVDWYSVQAKEPPAPGSGPEVLREVLPSRLKYPGAPHPRWWQIENAHVDIGGFPPDRSHLATMLLIDLVMSHADDWFSFPVEASAGTLVTLREVVVVNSFDEEVVLTAPADWSLFRITGLEPSTLAIWPTAVTPLSDRPVDDVAVGLDEDANLLWAVEHRAAGRDLAPSSAATGPTSPPGLPPQAPATSGEVLGSEPVTYSYRPSTTLPRFWHPYPVREVDGRRRFVQGQLRDLEARPPVPMPAPVSPLLQDPHAPAAGPVHQIEPAALPTTGVRLQRQWKLARRTDGRPVLWMQRQQLPLIGPPVSGLRFDVAEARHPSAG